MDFSEIALTGPEYRLLKSLYKIDDSRAIVFDASIAPAANRLIRLEFAALYFLPLAKAGRNVSPKSIVITDLGADYYIYLQKKSKKSAARFGVTFSASSSAQRQHSCWSIYFRFLPQLCTASLSSGAKLSQNRRNGAIFQPSPPEDFGTSPASIASTIAAPFSVAASSGCLRDFMCVAPFTNLCLPLQRRRSQRTAATSALWQVISTIIAKTSSSYFVSSISSPIRRPGARAG